MLVIVVIVMMVYFVVHNEFNVRKTQQNNFALVSQGTPKVIMQFMNTP